MDFYRFINSKDIREYHREIGYRYNAAEAAWLVYQCKDADVNEKHTAWKWIINNMEDYEVGERANYRTYSSVKKMLKEYIKLEDRLLGEFFTDDKSFGVYSYSEMYEDEDDCEWSDKWSDNDCLYASLSKCFDAISKDEDIVRYRIRKRYLECNKEITVTFDLADKYYFNLAYDANWDAADEEVNLKWAFMGMWFDFPTPFRKGDIIWDPEWPDNRGCCSGAFVNLGVGLDGIESERVKENIRKYGDDSDMTAGGYFACANGQIYREVTPNYMDMEFYPKRPAGAIRTLIPISNFLRGQIDLDLCVRAYHQIMTETMAGDAKVQDYLDDGLVLAGLKDTDSIKIWLDDERTAPYDYYHCHSVNEAKNKIRECERFGVEITEINCDHDLGDYADDGGDGIKLIDWLAERGTFYPIVIHTMNPVGRDNMQREIDRYWPEQVPERE